jgi:hypothetical protein
MSGLQQVISSRDDLSMTLFVSCEEQGRRSIARSASDRELVVAPERYATVYFVQVGAVDTAPQ